MKCVLAGTASGKVPWILAVRGAKDEADRQRVQDEIANVNLSCDASLDKFCILPAWSILRAFVPWAGRFPLNKQQMGVAQIITGGVTQVLVHVQLQGSILVPAFWATAKCWMLHSLAGWCFCSTHVGELLPQQDTYRNMVNDILCHLFWERWNLLVACSDGFLSPFSHCSFHLICWWVGWSPGLQCAPGELDRVICDELRRNPPVKSLERENQETGAVVRHQGPPEILVMST